MTCPTTSARTSRVGRWRAGRFMVVSTRMASSRQGLCLREGQAARYYSGAAAVLRAASALRLASRMTRPSAARRAGRREAAACSMPSRRRSGIPCEIRKAAISATSCSGAASWPACLTGGSGFRLRSATVWGLRAAGTPLVIAERVAREMGASGASRSARAPDSWRDRLHGEEFAAFAQDVADTRKLGEQMIKQYMGKIEPTQSDGLHCRPFIFRRTTHRLHQIGTSCSLWYGLDLPTSACADASFGVDISPDEGMPGPAVPHHCRHIRRHTVTSSVSGRRCWHVHCTPIPQLPQVSTALGFSSLWGPGSASTPLLVGHFAPAAWVEINGDLSSV